MIMRNIRRTKVIRLRMLIFGVFCVFVTSNQSNAQLTNRQKEIKHRIVSLGGEWELPSRLIRIVFNGPGFSKDEFQLLVELPQVQQLAIIGSQADEGVFEIIGKLPNLNKLEIQDCEFDGNGFAQLSKLKSLELILVDGTPLRDSAVSKLCSIRSLKKIVLSDVEFSGSILAKFAEMPSLERLEIHTKLPVENVVLNQLKTALPNCELFVLGAGATTRFFRSCDSLSKELESIVRLCNSEEKVAAARLELTCRLNDVLLRLNIDQERDQLQELKGLPHASTEMDAQQKRINEAIEQLIELRKKKTTSKCELDETSD